MSQAGKFTSLNDPIESITGNSGGAVFGTGGNVNLLGTDPISVTGTPATSTLVITVETATTTQLGVTELATDSETTTGTATDKVNTPASLASKLGTQTQYAVPYGEGTSSAFSWTSAATNGQLIIGATGAAPAFASLTSADSSVVFATGANTLDLTVDVAAAGGIETITGDSGGAISPDGSGDMGLVGGTTGLTFAGAGNAQTLGGTLVVSNGGTGNTTFTAYSVICAGTTATGTFQNVSGLGTSGQVLTSNGAAALPSWQDNANFVWNEETTPPVTMAAENGYVANDGSLINFTLPAAAAFGSRIRVVGKGAGGWRISQNAGQTITWDESASTTTGVGGYLESTDDFDAVELLCMTANNDFVVLSSKGNITIV